MERFIAVLMIVGIVLAGLTGCDWKSKNDRENQSGTDNADKAKNLPDMISSILPEDNQNAQRDSNRSPYTEYVPQN